MKGWRIIGERVKTPVGEVDLIARKANLVAFIEVKTRATAKELETAIDEYRLRRVAAAANALAARYAKPDDDIRIDVILITPRRWPKRIENAWMPMP
jgi:putative endonuclease